MKKSFGKLTRRDAAGAALFVVGSVLLLAGVAVESPLLTALGAIVLASVAVLVLLALSRTRAALARLSRDVARNRAATHAPLLQLTAELPTPAQRAEHAHELRTIRGELQQLMAELPTPAERGEELRRIRDDLHRLTAELPTPAQREENIKALLAIRRDLQILTKQSNELVEMLEPADASSPSDAGPERQPSAASLPHGASVENARANAAETLIERLLVERLVSVGRGALTPDEAATVSELWRAVARLRTVGHIELDASVGEWMHVVQPDLDAAAGSSDARPVFTVCRRGSATAAEHGSPVLSDEWGDALTVLHRSTDR